ncbi:MAG: (2Fe-2S)-binding protein [candidate division KSB1 bacterium]|nr:(2Fe-2S)-binding protein [candidate division KSB1 bacterium]MDZ7302725.1 (2Fe-2S)-binding protein [candidate division KSB1 bacterium]MDZ7311745.1 (2Fe-2S)-binding protein [candidate division KSB1 bacterium]
MPATTLTVNGKKHFVEVSAGTPLLWVLRDTLGLTGTKFSCGRGLCGSCTVHVDGEATRSCVLTIEDVKGKKITTIEGLAANKKHPLVAAWIAEEVPQCGYCQPGQIMQAAALLKQKPHPTDADIDAIMSTVLCRCGTYLRIRRAIHRAAKEGGGK